MLKRHGGWCGVLELSHQEFAFIIKASRESRDEGKDSEIRERSKMRDGQKLSNQSPCAQISSYRPGWPQASNCVGLGDYGRLITPYVIIRVYRKPEAQRSRNSGTMRSRFDVQA